MGHILADGGGETWNWVNTAITLVTAFGGIVTTYLIYRAGEDRKAIWDAIKEIRDENKRCDRERGEHEARLQAQEGFSPSRPRPPRHPP